MKWQCKLVQLVFKTPMHSDVLKVPLCLMTLHSPTSPKSHGLVAKHKLYIYMGYEVAVHARPACI